ncbi:hypothetical protein Tco_1084577, partial [Tanacetum coccineum]
VQQVDTVDPICIPNYSAAVLGNKLPSDQHGGLSTPTKTKHGNVIIERYLIMAFVRHCAAGTTVMDEDEVFLVAQLLGDLVSYRASGKGHLELLAGLALLRRESLMPKVQEGQGVWEK